MWICTKNNQLINTDNVVNFGILKGKDYYDDNAVLATYYYICANGNKVIKLANQDDAFAEFNSIKNAINVGETIYTANGMVMSEDEHTNVID